MKKIKNCSLRTISIALGCRTKGKRKYLPQSFKTLQGPKGFMKFVKVVRSGVRYPSLTLLGEKKPLKTMLRLFETIHNGFWAEGRVTRESFWSVLVFEVPQGDEALKKFLQ